MYNMKKGVIILATFSFVIGAIVFSLMLYTLTLEEQLQTTKDKGPVIENNVSSHHLNHAFGLHLDKKSIELIVSFVLLISFLTMMFSILLLIGVKKNKPSLVVAYFSFCSLLCLLLVISAVLELLQGLWPAAIITVLIALIMIERLPVVYTIYVNMVRESDSKLLLEEDELNDQEPIDNIICE